MLSIYEQRILGALYGQALGDAMGMPSELWPRARVKKHFGWIDHFLPGPKENNAACYFKAAEFTDDTSMALALADAIIEHHGTINPESIAKHIMIWAERFDAFNKNVLGPTSKVALTAIKQGVSIDSLPNVGVTNGAAMRVAPLGCLLPTFSLEHFITEIEKASSPTHKSDITIASATIIAWAISKAIEGSTWSEISLQLPTIAKTAQQYGTSTFSASLSSRIELALHVVRNTIGTEATMDQIYNLIGAGTSSIESIPATIAMVELSKTDPNQCAILSANLGGDTDTIGAMATAICGALNGITAIDEKLKHALDLKNNLNFNFYSKQLLTFRNEREAQWKQQNSI